MSLSTARASSSRPPKQWAQFSWILDSRSQKGNVPGSFCLNLPEPQDCSDAGWQMALKALYLLSPDGKQPIIGAKRFLLAVQCNEAFGSVVNANSSTIIHIKSVKPTTESIEPEVLTWCNVRSDCIRSLHIRLRSLHPDGKLQRIEFEKGTECMVQLFFRCLSDDMKPKHQIHPSTARLFRVSTVLPQLPQDTVGSEPTDHSTSDNRRVKRETKQAPAEKPTTSGEAEKTKPKAAKQNNRSPQLIVAATQKIKRKLAANVPELKRQSAVYVPKIQTTVQRQLKEELSVRDRIRREAMNSGPKSVHDYEPREIKPMPKFSGPVVRSENQAPRQRQEDQQRHNSSHRSGKEGHGTSVRTPLAQKENKPDSIDMTDRKRTVSRMSAPVKPNPQIREAERKANDEVDTAVFNLQQIMEGDFGEFLKNEANQFQDDYTPPEKRPRTPGEGEYESEGERGGESSSNTSRQSSSDEDSD